MTDTAEPQTQPSQQNAQAQQPQQSSQQSKHMMTPREKKWIVYDVGNSAFVLLSTAVVPIYANSLLKAAGETNIVSTWGYAQTIASLVIAVLMPLLGSIADVQGMKIRFFTGFFDGRGHVLRDGDAAWLARVPHRVRAGHHRP